MPAFTPIILMDGKTTPVAHTFDLVNTSNGRTKTANRAAATPLAQENLNVEVKQPSNAAGAFRVITTLGSPVGVVGANGLTTVDHVNSSELVFNWSQTSTRAERKDVFYQMKSLMANTVFEEVCLDIEPIFG